MKLKTSSLLSICAFATASLLLTTSCSKSNSNPGESDQLSATIGGTAFQPSLVKAFDDGYEINVAGGQIKGKDTLNFSVNFPNTSKAGSTISNDLTYIYYNKNSAFYENDYLHQATITLSTFDTASHKISGSFSGTIANDDNPDDSVKVSGKFNTTYTPAP